MQWGQKTVSNGGMGWEGRLHSQNPIVHQALLKEHKVVEHSTLFPRSHDAKCACSRSSGSLHTHQPTHFIHLLQAQGKYYKLLSTSTYTDLFPTGNQLWLNWWYLQLLSGMTPCLEHWHQAKSAILKQSIPIRNGPQKHPQKTIWLPQKNCSCWSSKHEMWQRTMASTGSQKTKERWLKTSRMYVHTHIYTNKRQREKRGNQESVALKKQAHIKFQILISPLRPHI